MNKLLAIFIAVAVLLAPAFTRAGEAFAAVPDHHAQMMKSGHCEKPAGDSGTTEDEAAQSCCVAMCMGVASAPLPSPSHEAVTGASPMATVRSFQLGLPPEIATPPPRPA